MQNNNSKNILEFLEIVGRLKHTVRKGWELRNIPAPECVAGHMYRMAIMTFLLNSENDQKNLDKVKCMQMALVHDLAESIVGDITPLCGVDPVEKHRREDEAMAQITSLIGEQGQQIYRIFQEYEHHETDEAKFVKDIDRFDMILQAFEYEKRDNKPKSLEEFFVSVEGKFTNPLIKSLCDELYSQRNNFNSG